MTEQEFLDLGQRDPAKLFARLMEDRRRLLEACEAAAGLESSIDPEAWYGSSHCPDVFRKLRSAITKAKDEAA